MDSVELTSSAAPTVRVERADLTGFDLPPAGEEVLVDDTRVVALRPISVVFAEGNKWRVSDGDATFWASIHDAQFSRRVEAGQEAFTKSDIMRAKVWTRQWRDSDGELRTERQIVEVIDHVRGTRTYRCRSRVMTD